MTHPKFVGQQKTSPTWTSACAHESAAHLIGERWVHGIAFGSPNETGKKKKKGSNIENKT